MQEDVELSNKIKEIVEGIYPKPDQISLAVIDLKAQEPKIAGYNLDQLIYPASVYKIFIGAEILRKIETCELKLEQKVHIESPNDVDKNYKLFPKSTKEDHRPLLKANDEVTIDYLLDLVFSRSDNTAANVLVDIAKREDINKHIILSNGWKGSEVTRKFLERPKEEEKYQHSAITVSSARHLVEFMYKVETGKLISPWVSGKMKSYLHKWGRGGKTGLYLPEFKDYYRKGGWLEINGYKIDLWQAIKRVWENKTIVNKWSSDIGVVTGRNSQYAIAVLSLTKSKWPWTRLNLKRLSQSIYAVMEISAN